MANPLYHDDPEWFERPGETVLLDVDVKPTLVAVPALPWKMRVHPVDGSLTQYPEGRSRFRCAVCARDTFGSTGARLCAYCSRAQAADETHRARAKQPQPSTVRIGGMREPWER